MRVLAATALHLLTFIWAQSVGSVPYCKTLWEEQNTPDGASCIPCPAGYACPGGEQGLATPMIKCPAAIRMGYTKCPEETDDLKCALAKFEAVANKLHTKVHAVGHHEAADE